MKEPTQRDADVLRAIDTYEREHCIPPSQKEIAVQVAVRSLATVKYHLTRLREFGVVTWDEDKVRSYRIVDRRQAVRILQKYPESNGKT